ncbi:hypothetical protein ACFQZZ_09085 [Nocardia sp. GCM10030253]|uniref:hypothetical protein n=1 Tax=Nocardia sp. GCM10030253 TaxID=3273404 RepID=UPI003637E8D2
MRARQVERLTGQTHELGSIDIPPDLISERETTAQKAGTADPRRTRAPEFLRGIPWRA